MAQKDDDVRTRLQRMALELFGEQGYERTTAAQIATRAGVTERTFFRYFPDKREVLFDGEAVLRAALTAAIAQVPDDIGPLDTLFRAFQAIRPLLEANRPFAKPRQDIISATPALQERELAKLAVLANALAASLRARGVAELRSILAAQTAMAMFTHATVSWLEDPGDGLAKRLDQATLELRALFADSSN